MVDWVFGLWPSLDILLTFSNSLQAEANKNKGSSGLFSVTGTKKVGWQIGLVLSFSILTIIRHTC